MTLIAILALAAAVLFGFAQYWSRTPHGRIKPIFALVFKLSPLLNPTAAGRALGAEHMDTPEQAAKVRADFLRNTAGLSKHVDFDGRIENRVLVGPGGDLPIRIYRPVDEGPCPLVVYFHGGGFIVGSPDYTDAVTRILATRARAVVVSVDYRLAPEHRFPAAADDCEFAVRWCFENAESLGAQKGPVAVAGDSAGGNLSAVVAQRDAREGAGRIGLQVLIYPITDFARTDRPSRIAFGEGYGLCALDMEDALRHYAPPGTDPRDPDLSPLYAKSFEGLPRAYVVTAGFDLLRDEGIEYAVAMKEAGVEVEHVNDPTMPHGFITMTRLCSEAETHLSFIAAKIRAMA